LFDVSLFAGQVRPPSLTFTITSSTSPFAVAAMDDQVFVIRGPKSSDQIEVYNATTFQLTRYITVFGATGFVYGLTVSSTYNSLFVSDYTNNFVHKVNLSSTSTIKWSVCSSPSSLSVNKAHNVLVACYSGYVQEYTTDGSLVRTLTDSGSNLYQAVETKGGMRAISRYYKNQVCQMSITGTVLKCFGTGASGSGPGQLNYPLSLAADRNGNIAVADYYNNRILVLNATLSEARNFSLPINTGVINNPRGLWLDESRGRLYVAEEGGQKRVLVFDNVYNLNEASTP
jgi:DNA-binding beta-propeller fold protein YncE